MLAEHHRAVQHAGPLHVVDVLVHPQGEVLAVPAAQAFAHPAVVFRFRNGLASPGRGHHFDGVEDAQISGAAAEMRVERLGDFLAAGVGVAFQQPVGAQRDSGDAKATLQTGCGRETAGDEAAVLLADALQGEDLLAVGLFHRDGTGRLGLAVD